jgi:1,6-anhydro-N-acetylmuramate kinase
MSDVQRFDRLRAVAQRKRWLIGLRVDGRCRTVRAALVGVDGRGLASRVECFAQDGLALPREVSARFERLRTHQRASPAETSLLAAQLAESQAALLEQMVPQVAPVWDRLLALAVDDPGVWRRWRGIHCRADLCDPARLAELSGQNVIDSFAARDLAQGGQGRPLAPIPEWILLHDVERARAVARVGRLVRITYLPASRDAAGAARVRSIIFKPSGPDRLAEGKIRDLANEIADHMITELPQSPPIEELFLATRSTHHAELAGVLKERLPGLTVAALDRCPFPMTYLPAASTAVLGLLHLDQVPANSTEATSARTPRVLGRLTPGLPGPWHRLLRELAATKPAVMTLRSAI